MVKDDRMEITLTKGADTLSFNVETPTKEADFEVAIPKIAIYVLTEVRQAGCGR